MAKTITTANRKAGKVESGKIVTYQLDIRQIMRTVQDIQTWRQAITSAENINFPNKIKLFDLYYDLLLDAHLTSVIDARKTSVLKSPITFSKEGKENEVICKLIKSPQFLDMLDNILDTRYWGHTLIEFEPGQLLKPHLIPRKHVVPEKGIVIINQNDQNGIEYREPPYSNFMIEIGKPGDLGLLVKAAQYVIYKRNCLGDYSQYSEIFGQPLRKGTYNPYDEISRTELKKSMEEMGSSAWAIFPEGTNIEFIESASKTGSAELYKGLIELCNKEISKLILGETLTTDQGSLGTQALGNVHADVAEEKEYADKTFIINFLNNEFFEFLNNNGWPTDGEFSFQENEIISLKDDILIDEKLSAIIPLDDDYFYEHYGRPKPANYNELKKKMDEDKAANNNPFGFPTAGNQDPKTKQQNITNKLNFWNRFSFFPIARH